MMTKGTILIIDDNPLNTELGAELLEEAGFRVVVASDSNSGLEAVQHYHPDLILLDLHLPDQDGFSLARLVKATPGLQEIPIVAFTAMAMPDARKAALECGCCAVIPKPVDLNTFAETVESCLANGGANLGIQDEKSSQHDVMQDRGYSTLSPNILQHFENLIRHDLKSPLCSSKIALEILLSGRAGTLNNRQEELLSEVLASQQYVLNRLDYLYSIALYEKGQFLQVQEPVEILSVIVELLEGPWRFQIEEKNLKIDVDMGPADCLLKLDKAEVTKALRIIGEQTIQSMESGAALKISVLPENNQLLLRIHPESKPPSSRRKTEMDQLEWDYCKHILEANHSELQVDDTATITVVFHTPPPVPPPESGLRQTS